MGKGINHFMWGYQEYYRIGVKISANEVFQDLNSKFQPEVFIIGVLIDDAQSYPACVEPEEGTWLQSKELYNLRDLIKDTIETFPESEIIHSHPIAQKNADERLIRRAVRQLIKDSIQGHPLKPESKEYFVSYPVILNNYWVSVVLGLEENIINSYPSLLSKTLELHEFKSFDVCSGLIDAVISSFLEECSRTLQLPNPGAGNLDIIKDNILRKAGHSLIQDAAFRADSSCISGSHSIFETSNKISCTNYEKSVGSGSIILASRSNSIIKPIITFSSEPQLNIVKNTRKLLELTTEDLYLHSNSEKIFTLAKLNSQTELNEDVFFINFIGHHHWELIYQNQCLMRVLYGLPYLPKPSFDSKKVAEDLTRIFKKISSNSISRVLKLLRTAEKESHGTMLLISSKAKDEAHRLCIRGQGTEVSPKRLTPEILQNLTSIDGTVIISPAGTCYAIGAILDGLASDNGDPSRGARYNSAVRYVESNPNSMAIVVSEDGGMDIIPDLKRCVARRDIEKYIQSLEKVADSSIIETKEFYRLRSWLDERRFYLLVNDCKRINQSCKKVHENLSKAPSESGLTMILMPEFEPNESLDQNFYYK